VHTVWETGFVIDGGVFTVSFAPVLVATLPPALVTAQEYVLASFAATEVMVKVAVLVPA
jgi:hypothetical protein